MRLLSFLFIFIFFFSSSSLVHASSMDTFSHSDEESHDVGYYHHWDCDEAINKDLDNTWSCIEDCIGEYDDILTSHYNLLYINEYDREPISYRKRDYKELPHEDVIIAYIDKRIPYCLTISPYPEYVGITLMTI